MVVLDVANGSRALSLGGAAGGDGMVDEHVVDRVVLLVGHTVGGPCSPLRPCNYLHRRARACNQRMSSCSIMVSCCITIFNNI